MMTKIQDPKVWLLTLASIKGILTLFGIEVFTSAQAEIIANGLSVLVTVCVAAYVMVKKALADAQIADLKVELARANKTIAIMSRTR